MIGLKAPDFTGPAVLSTGEITDKFNLHEALKGKYGLLFFYPLDFTYVCPTELKALDNRMDKFASRDVAVVAVSIDSQYTHLKFRSTPAKEGGIGPVKFPLVADMTHAICQSYGVQHPVAGVAFRAAFIIDKSGIVRSQIICDLSIGRDIDEILRLIDAMQFVDEHGDEVCPAGWTKGQKGMKPKEVASYLNEHADSL
jgi:peroxiredoxin 2/4